MKTRKAPSYQDMIIENRKLKKQVAELEDKHNNLAYTAVTVTCDKYSEIMRHHRISETRAAQIREEVIASIVAAGED